MGNVTRSEWQTGCIITRAKQNVTATSISKEDYLRNEVWKGNKQEADNKLSKLIDRFTKKYNHEKLKRMDMGRQETEPKVIWPTENMDIECNEILTLFIANKALHKKNTADKHKIWKTSSQ